MAVENTNDQYMKVATSSNGDTTFKSEPYSKKFGIRHGQMIIFFLCLVMNLLARVHIGVTIVAMTSTTQAKVLASGAENQTEIHNNITNVYNNKTINIVDTNIGSVNITNETIGRDTAKQDDKYEYLSVYRTYNWTKAIQETVMSSFFLGYCIAMIPMGMVAQRWGGKFPLQLSLLLNCVVSLLTPWLALWGGWKAVSASRLVLGLCQAGLYPSLQILLSNWVPINERAAWVSYVYTGSTVGNIIAFQIGGLLADSVGGWPSTFWVVGLMSLACFILLTVCGTNTPQQHIKITAEEKFLIIGYSDEVSVQRLKKPIPWKAIMTSVPVWSNFIAQIGTTVAFLFFCSQVASYNHYVLRTNVKNSGFLSSMPYISGLFSSFFYGWISDYMTKGNIITVKTARRLFGSISQVGTAASLIGVTVSKSTVTASLCFIFFMTCQTASHCGFMVNHIDIASNYSGTLMSIGNTMTNIVNVIIPVVMANIVVDVNNPAQWHTMFYLVAGLSFVTNIIFVVFLSVEDQPWNNQYVHDVENEDAKEKSTTEKDQLEINLNKSASGSSVIPKITEKL